MSEIINEFKHEISINIWDGKLIIKTFLNNGDLNSIFVIEDDLTIYDLKEKIKNIEIIMKCKIEYAQKHNEE